MTGRLLTCSTTPSRSFRSSGRPPVPPTQDITQEVRVTKPFPQLPPPSATLSPNQSETALTRPPSKHYFKPNSFELLWTWDSNVYFMIFYNISFLCFFNPCKVCSSIVRSAIYYDDYYYYYHYHHYYYLERECCTAAVMRTRIFLWNLFHATVVKSGNGSNQKVGKN